MRDEVCKQTTFLYVRIWWHTFCNGCARYRQSYTDNQVWPSGIGTICAGHRPSQNIPYQKGRSPSTLPYVFIWWHTFRKRLSTVQHPSHCFCVFTMVLYYKKSIWHECPRYYARYIIAFWPQNMIWPLIGRYQTTHMCKFTSWQVFIEICMALALLSSIIVTRDTNCGLRTDGRTDRRTDGWTHIQGQTIYYASITKVVRPYNTSCRVKTKR